MQIDLENQVFLNGDFELLSQAKVSVLDRGYIFGDGVYEVIPVYGLNPFRLTEHLQRLSNSLNAVSICSPYNEQQWQIIIKQLLSLNASQSPNGDFSIYLQITRGVAKRDHAFPDAEAGVFIMCTPLMPMSEQIKDSGVSAITLVDNRWLNCHIKAISLLPNILLRQQAIEQDAQEAILLRDGIATEGAASNLFIVEQDTLLTPPKSSHLLPGITRDLIVEIAKSHNIAIKETAINAEQLKQADEVWLTSSTKEILPVTKLDGKNVGTGKPGNMWHTMMQYYQQYKAKIRENVD